MTIFILSFSIAAAILIALYVVRQHRRSIERNQASEDARGLGIARAYWSARQRAAALRAHLKAKHRLMAMVI